MAIPEILNKKQDRVPKNLAFIFVILSVGIILLGIYFYFNQRESIIKQQQNELSTISNYKAKQIETWLEERRKHANSIIENKHRISQIIAIVNKIETAKNTSSITEWFKYLHDLYGYTEITLLDNNYNQLINYPDEEITGKDKEIDKLNITGLLNEIKISDIHIHDSVSQAHINIYIPINNTEYGNKSLSAVLIFHFDLYTYIFPTLNELPSRYNTMESLMAEKKGDSVLFLSELKFKKNAPLQFTIPLTKREVIAVQAAEGKTGITQGKDYRSKEVLACIERIKGTSWFLITKIDTEEVNAPILRHTIVVFLVVFFSIIAAGIVIGLIWHNQRARHYHLLYNKEVEARAMAEHYAYLSRYANDIILLEDENLDIIEANDKAVECYKYTKDELLRLNVKDIRAPGHTHDIKIIVEKVNSAGGNIFETEHVRKDGSTFPVEISTRLINVDGKIFYQSIIRDISERKKNEEIIKKNEILANSVIQNSPVGITIRDTSGKLLTYNKAWMKIWGFDDKTVKELEETSLRMTFEERYSYFGNELEKIKSAFEYGKDQYIPEFKIDNPYTGKETWLSIYIYALKSNGTAGQIVTLTRDITDQKHSQEKLKESEEKHRFIIEHSTVLFYSHTTNNVITYISPQTQEFFDCEPDEALENWTNFATDNPVNELGFYLTKKAIETGKAQPPYELELKGKKGRIIWVEVHESPVVIDGKTIAMIGSLTDITARKKAEEKLFKLNRIYKVLSEINQAIVRVKSEMELFEQISRILVEIGNFKMVMIAEVDLLNHSVSKLGVSGFDDGYSDLIISNNDIIFDPDSNLYKDITEKKIQIFNDLENDLHLPWRKESVKRGYASLCAVPLNLENKRNIFMNLYSGEYQFFNEAEIGMLTELAADVSFALNSLEQEKLRKNAETALKNSKDQLEMLYDTSENLSRSLNPEDTYKAIIEFISKFMDCEGLIISEYKSNGKKIYYKAAWIQGLWSETANIPPIDLAPEGKGILSRVIRSGKSLIINDYIEELKKSETKFKVDESGKTHDISSDRKDDTRSALLVPLKVEGKVIGVLHIISFRKDAYTEEHKKLLESISVHISSAINNATLYRLAKEEINERKRTEIELRRSEERFSQTFKLSPIAMSLTRLEDGTFIDINDSYIKLLGFTYDDIRGLKTTDLNIWDSETRDNVIQALKSSGLIRDLEIKIRSKVGKEIDSLTTLQIVNISGEDCIIAMVQDITEKKKSEEQLRKLSRAVNQSPASIIITDINGNIEYVNSKFTEVTGYTYSEVIGQNPRILKSGETTEETYKELWKTVSSGNEWHGELHNRKKNGELFWEWASISAVLDSKGKVTNYLAVKEDITASKIIQEQIQLQATLIQNIHDAIIFIDLDGRIKSWNEGAQSIYGWSAEEAKGKIMPELVKAQFYNTNLESVISSVNTKGTWKGEITELTKNGATVNILSSASAIHDSKGKAIGVIIVNKDITERKLNEEKIKNSLKEKEVLLKEIHHRVKNNLQVISSLLKMQAGYIKDPTALDYFKISSQRVKSMALIHEQLYRSADLSKIDFHSYVKKLATHLYQTYGINMEIVKLEINIKNIKLSIDTAIPCGLIVNELISNSLKHAFQYGQNGKIEIEMTQVNNKYILIVRDTGKGFPEKLDFKNTETLGMQLINTLTEQIDGNIELNNDNGTEFIITFKATDYKDRI